MPELPFLEKYRGESAQQLLDLRGTYRTDSLLMAMKEGINQKPEATWSFEERVVVAVEEMEGYVNGDGFNGFFTNSPEHVPVIVHALQTIGCPKFAEIVAGAIQALGPIDIQDAGAIEEATLDDDISEALNEWDEKFYTYPEDISEALITFVEKHASSFSLGS